MSPRLLKALRARNDETQRRWEALLRIEPVNSALALPDALSHLIPASLDKIYRTMAKRHSDEVTLEQVRTIKLPACGCQRNPYEAYFHAAEQAVSEQVILIQADLAADTRREQDLAEVIRAVRVLASDEIGTFCSLCASRGKLRGCRFHSVS